jgi:hypothetical protein
MKNAIEKWQMAQHGQVADDQKQTVRPCTRPRAPEPVNLRRQREDVIIKKDDLVDQSEYLLDMRMNKPYAAREEASPIVNLSKPRELGALASTTSTLHVLSRPAKWCAHEGRKIGRALVTVGASVVIGMLRWVDELCFYDRWSWHWHGQCGYCSDIPRAHVDIKYLRYESQDWHLPGTIGVLGFEFVNDRVPFTIAVVQKSPRSPAVICLCHITAHRQTEFDLGGTISLRETPHSPAETRRFCLRL